MKGVILAGGTGSRLFPLTRVTNKHLLPVYNQPMIFYPVETLKKAGVTDILIILGGESVGDLIRLLGSGRTLGVNLTYRYQEEAGGIAEALGLAEGFVGQDHCIVILGDNVIEDNLSYAVLDFMHSGTAEAGIFLKEVADPERFGVAEVRDGKVVHIVEKPANPVSKLAVTGVYLYTPDVFAIIRTLHRSARGELEITDVNNAYIERDALKVYYLTGFWTDAGTFTSLYRANTLACQAALKGENHK